MHLLGISMIVATAAFGCSGADARVGTVEGTSSVARPAMRETMDSAALERAYERARQLPRLRSLLVQWKGDLVREEYYGGTTAARRVNIKSASKSVMSALVGIAIAEGHIRGLVQTIG